MVRINEKSLFSFLIFLFTLILMLNTLGMRSDVALVPRILGIPLLFLSFFQFLIDVFPGLRKKKQHTKPEDKNDKENDTLVMTEEEVKETAYDMKRRYLLVGWTILFLIIAYFVNMISAIVICIFLYLKFMIKKGWILSVAYPLIFALIIYFLFVVGMDISYFI